ncbi:MAG: FkbM family methyltransferase [Anaerolineales bacterium]|jgi:FkbM family methyltransferase
MLKSYAQLGQDFLALKFFRLYPARHKIFLDIGAFDGINFSNTRLLFEQGWGGFCVEPVMKNYQKLEKLYQGTSVTTVRAAAADYEGEVSLNVATIPWAPDWGSDVSSPRDDALERWPDYIWGKETVPVMTVNKILEGYKVDRLDFVSIDVEGQEMSVLFGFNLFKYLPQLIVVEYSSLEERKELVHYFRQHGYFIWSDNRQDLFAVRGSMLNHLRVLSLGFWQSFCFSKNVRFIVGKMKRFVK